MNMGYDYDLSTQLWSYTGKEWTGEELQRMFSQGGPGVH